MPPMLALIAASLASVPGLFVGFYIAFGRKMALKSAWKSFLGIAIFLPFYLIAGFGYGFPLWLALDALGQLNLAGFLLGSLLPGIAYLLFDILLRGYRRGWGDASIAFGVPCLFMGLALWMFSPGAEAIFR